MTYLEYETSICCCHIYAAASRAANSARNAEQWEKRAVKLKKEREKAFLKDKYFVEV